MQVVTLVAWWLCILIEIVSAARLPRSAVQGWLGASAARDIAILLVAYMFPSLYRPAWIVTAPILSVFLLNAVIETERPVNVGTFLLSACTMACALLVCIFAAGTNRDAVLAGRLVIDGAIMICLLSRMCLNGWPGLQSIGLLLYCFFEIASYVAMLEHEPGSRYTASALLMGGQAGALALFLPRRNGYSTAGH